MKIDKYVVMMALMTIATDAAHIASTIRSWKADPISGLWMIAILVCFNSIMLSLTMDLINEEEES